MSNPVIPIRKDFIDLIDISITCPKYFEAPIYDNTEIGKLIISWGNSNILENKIFVSSTIKKKSIYSYLSYFLKNFNTLLQENL